MVLSPSPCLPFWPARRLSASFGLSGRRANLAEKPAQPLQHALWRRLLLGSLPGQRLISDQFSGQKQLPLGQRDQLRPPVADIRILKTGQRPGQGLFAKAGAGLNGTITNDKFCMSRTGRLALTWWRRPLRSRSAKVDEGVYPSGEIACRGGIHESSMEGPPPVD
jgi:hypothetical protein